MIKKDNLHIFSFLILFIITAMFVIKVYFVSAAFTITILDAPADNYFTSDTAIKFNCTATISDADYITNLTLFTNFIGTFEANQSNTTQVNSGETYEFTVNDVPDGTWLWGCLAEDNSSNLGWSATNRTIIADSTNNFIMLSDIEQFNVTVNGTNTYTLSVNISNNWGTTANDTVITWYLPHGVVNNSVCNGSEISSYKGFDEINVTTSTCDTLIGNISASTSTSANETYTLDVKIGLNSFTDYDIALPFYVTVNCSDGCIQNTTSLTDVYGTNYWKNPRPYAQDNNSNANTTLNFDDWLQTRSLYEAWVPLYSYNTTSRSIYLSTNSFSGLVYTNKPFFEHPDYLELASYNLTFTLYFNTSTELASDNENAIFRIKTADYNKTYQALYPLKTETSTKTDPFDGTNYNQSKAIPDPTDFDVIYNDTNYNSSYLSSAYGINVTYIYNNTVAACTLRDSPGGTGEWNWTCDSTDLLRVEAPTNLNNITLSMLFGLVPDGLSSETSPIWVINQNITGFSPENPPDLGETLNNSYYIEIQNILTNFTFDQLLVHIVQPMTARLYNSTDGLEAGPFNMTENLWYGWLNSSGDWDNASTSTPNEYTTWINMTDSVTGSPSNGYNVSIEFTIIDINLSTSAFNNWEPGQADSNATINMTSTIQFPALKEDTSTSGTAGSSNSYNVSMSMASEAQLTIPTSNLPGLTNNTCGENGTSCSVTLTIDGVTYTSGENFTAGSVTTTNSVGSGSHSVSVGYSVPAAAAAAGGSGGAAGAALATAGPQDYYFDITRGESHYIDIDDKGRFNLKGISHEIKVTKVTKDSVTLIITSTPITLTLKVGEIKEIDIDENGKNDLRIELKRTYYETQAELYFKEIKEEEIEKIKEKKEEIKEIAKKIKEEIKSTKISTPRIILIVILVIAIGYYLYKKKKTS